MLKLWQCQQEDRVEYGALHTYWRGDIRRGSVVARETYLCQEVVMARWEYCRISWTGHAGAPDALMGAVGAAGGQASTVLDTGQQRGHTGWLEHLGSVAAAERITRLDDTIARLGRAGWELVSHVQLHDGAPVQHWYFK